MFTTKKSDLSALNYLINAKFIRMIRAVTLIDAEELANIYNPFIRSSSATFEETEITVDEMRNRIQSIHFEKNYPYLIFEQEGKILGYAYGSSFRERISYRFTAESTVYVDPDFAGRGIGKQLYTQLLKELRASGFHSVIGVITLPNEPSVKLHEQFGFKKAGHFTESGFKFNQWMDVGFWELLLK